MHVTRAISMEMGFLAVVENQAPIEDGLARLLAVHTKAGPAKVPIAPPRPQKTNAGN